MTNTIDTATHNGVDTATLFATLDAVKAAPQAAQFQFRADNQWTSGTHSRSTIDDFYGVGEQRTHQHSFTFDADHPASLLGRDNGPTPVELAPHALPACLANIAAARNITVRSTVKGDAQAEKLRALVEQSRNHSAVYDILTNQVPVTIEIDID